MAIKQADVIGGYRGEPIKNSMLGKNMKSRGFLSNNLPFRLANGLAPGNPLQFLWPTGTEAGAYWDFGNSGGQYQSTVPATAGNPKLTAVGQAIGAQLDKRISSISHSIDLNSKSPVIVGNVSVGTNTITFNNAAVADKADFGIEFSANEYPYLECYFTVDAPASTNPFFVRLGNVNSLFTLDGNKNSIYCAQAIGAISGGFSVQCFTAGFSGKITILSITGYPGNHLSQSTSTSRPLTTIESIGTWNQSVYSGRFDGIDDGMSTPTFAAGTLTNNMDCFVAVKRTNPAATIFGSTTVASGANAYFLSFINSAGVSYIGVGAPTIYVNGIATGNQLSDMFNALPAGQWAIVEHRNLDLSLWTSFPLMYGSSILAGNLGTVALCPAQSAANRELARRIIGAEVGVLL